MKTKSIFAILALTSLSALANPTTQDVTLPQQQVVPQAQPPVQAPAPQTYAPQPQPYAQPPYPQQNYYGLPQKIMTTIQKMYPGTFIKDVDWEPYGYEIELSNRMEMHFDRNGNLLGQKWDD